MGFPSSSAVLPAVAIALALTSTKSVAGSRGDGRRDAGDRPLAAACQDCPIDAVFLRCTQGNDAMTLVLAPDRSTGFRMASWRGMLVGKALRVGEVLTLEVRSELKGANRVTRATLRLGEAATLVPGSDVDAELVGGNGAPIRFTWLE